jgi:hypothetical protein
MLIFRDIKLSIDLKDIKSLQNRFLKACYVPATSTRLPRLIFILFLLLPLSVLMKQTRQALCAVKQSILLICLWLIKIFGKLGLLFSKIWAKFHSIFWSRYQWQTLKLKCRKEFLWKWDQRRSKDGSRFWHRVSVEVAIEKDGVEFRRIWSHFCCRNNLPIFDQNLVKIFRLKLKWEGKQICSCF